MSPEQLARQKAKEWRERAAEFREVAAEAQAATSELLADELEQLFSAHLDEELTLQEADEESGYDSSHLGRLVRQGTIPNAGTEEAPRIRRRDLPRKPGSTWPEAQEPGATESGSPSDAVDAVLRDHEETIHE